MLVKAKRTQNVQRRRQSPAGHAQSRSPLPVSPPLGQEQRPDDAGRLANDHALYSCQCGYVFEAPVCTSVGCPHCGGTQAW